MILENSKEEKGCKEGSMEEKKYFFFYLPYWEFNVLRHNINAMHIEKKKYREKKYG